MAIYDIGGEYRDIDTEEQIYTAIEDKMSYEFVKYIKECLEEYKSEMLYYKDEYYYINDLYDDLADRFHDIRNGLRDILSQVDGSSGMNTVDMDYDSLVDTLRDFVNETF